jgi:hypothetical protein
MYIYILDQGASDYENEQRAGVVTIPFPRSAGHKEER